VTSYLVTGGGGMLAAELARALAGREVTVATRADLDITDQAAVDDAVPGNDVIINAAAWTNVDAAESQEAEATLVNGEGAANLARAAAKAGAVLVQVSTDYVFDGRATTPYAESAPRHPVSAYGRSKAVGEQRAMDLNPERTIIVRTAWLYGTGGANFAKTMLRLAGERDTLAVVDDQLGQPTWAGDLAGQLVDLLDTGTTTGILHGTNSGEATWYDFARAIFEEAGLDHERITRTTSAEFVRPAPRPGYSVLGHDGWAATGLVPMRPWRDALSAAFSAGLRDIIQK